MPSFGQANFEGEKTQKRLLTFWVRLVCNTFLTECLKKKIWIVAKKLSEGVDSTTLGGGVDNTYLGNIYSCIQFLVNPKIPIKKFEFEKRLFDF